MWSTEKLITKYGIGLGLVGGLTVFVTSIPDSGVLRRFDFGLLTALGFALMERIGARLFGERGRHLA